MVSPDDDFEHHSWEDPLALERVGPGEVNVYFQPQRRFGATADERDTKPDRVRLFQVNVLDGLLTMFPMKNLVYPERAVRSKYDRIKRISFSGGRVVYSGANPTTEEQPEPKFLGSYFGKTKREELDHEIRQPELDETVPTSTDDILNLLAGLPPYCVKDPQYGLGFRRAYRSVLYAIEELTDAQELHITQDGSTEYREDSKTFVVSASDMLTLKKLVDRVNNTSRAAANTVNQTSTYNEFAAVLGLPSRPMKYGRAELRKALTALLNGERPLSRAEQTELVDTLAENASSILEHEPATLDGLESGIVTARTRDLLDNLRKMMKTEHDEETWQDFLQANPFVLSMVFGRPFVYVADQASVGGRKIDGSGDKITDFLVKNSLTNNAALVEIKTPKLRLLNQRAYRKGVYVPSRELVGAMNQALDQKKRFEDEIAWHRHRNPTLRVEAHHVQAYLLAGRMPAEDDRVRSFEIFRHNSKDVVVMTFDELLSKVEHLCTFLERQSSPEGDSACPREDQTASTTA